MKDNGDGKPVCVKTEPDGRNHVTVDQTQTQTQNLVAVDQTHGSQNLVSLAQIAELVINQGCLETSDGLNPNIHQLQIGSDANNQPYVLSGLDSNISSVQTVTSTPRKISQMRAPSRKNTTEYIAVPLKKPLPGSSTAGASNYTTTILPDSRNPPQKLPPERNIYSKIKAENGECYMVVLPDSDTLNPTQLRDLLTSYSASHTKSALGDRSESAEVTIKVEPEKPMMYSAGSQTSNRKYSKLWPTANKSSNVVVTEAARSSCPGESVERQVTGGDTSSKETSGTASDLVVEVVKLGNSTNDDLFDNTVKVKIEKPDEAAEVAGEEDQASSMIDSIDNCGHEVAAGNRRSSSEPRPETRTVTVQTDITSECYINVTPEELNINRRKPRVHAGRKRLYLDDPRPSTDSAQVVQTLVSPFLKRKKLLDLENAFYICGTCESKFSTADELKTHSKEHKLKNVFCPACKRKCSNVKILADHVISHTRCKTFKCSVCTTKTVFRSAEAFKTHVSEHLSVQHFRCGSCGQKFPHVANLRVHMRVHTGEKPFICDKCPMAFSQKAPLEAHVSSFHNKEKPFQCGECSINFARKTDLKIHMRIHTGERPYKCELCGKTFTSNSGLTSHKKTHFRSRYHKCSNCEKSFDTPTRLKRHVALWHSGDRVLKCRICNKEIGNKSELRAHMQLHSSEPFPCVRCGYGTDKKDLLANHIQENHPELVSKMPELFDSNAQLDQEGKTADTKVIEIKW
ncbi:zinc finger protein 62-like [Haliotis rubra]|uniref:zinc finger protein 62-like n=1 Tax=Haliotis rubra TaxID=36100 RepID=UPI001EE6351F|nr:zinc finger protein 62-like [Haliotis rubra]XP_046554280.1 zinc finger protein 62-like [Haliotis rubra]